MNKIIKINSEINWIECGLPFHYDSPKFPDMPNMEKEFENEFSDEFHGMSIPYIEFIKSVCITFIEKHFDEISDAQEKTKNLIEKECSDFIHIDYTNKYHTDIFEKELMSQLEKVPNVEQHIKSIIAYRKYRQYYDIWFGNHQLILSWKEAVNKIYEENKRKSFSGLGLNKAGTLIEVNVDGVLKTFLIGHINQCIGICDCCNDFNYDCIITRYAVLIEFEESSETN